VAAKRVGAIAEVTLKLPPPLNQPLHARPMGLNGVMLVDDGRTVAEAWPATLDDDVPAAVPFDSAVRASENYAGFRAHPFARCFVCGPERTAADGMRIFPGALDAQRLVAPWLPDAGLADGAGLVNSEFVWAALDCPSGWAAALLPPGDKVVVLGRLTAALRAPVHAGRRYVVLSWAIGASGRKYFTASAIYSATGELCANATATWIRIKGQPETPGRSSLRIGVQA
jgi:hypothetical protein